MKKRSKTVYLRTTTVPESIEILLEGQPEFLTKQGFDVHLASSGQLDERLSHFKHHSIPFNRRIDLLGDIKALWSIITVIQNIKPDIIHSHTPKAGLLTMLGGSICGTKFRIHTVAGLPQTTASGFTRAILTFSEFITYACATKIYFNSFQQMEAQKKAFPIYKDKMNIIWNGSSNGIDINHYRPYKKDTILLQQNDLNNSCFTWMFIGRLHADKGIYELIEAYQKFESKYPHQTQLVLVGGLDPARNSITNMWIAKIMKETPSIRFVGHQKNIPNWLSLADVFIFPSHREGFPNAPLQAACMGIPVIATDINGCNELIQDGINGYLVKVKDPMTIYKRMVELYSSPTLRKSMGAKSLEIVPKRFNRKDFHFALLNEYQNILNQNL